MPKNEIDYSNTIIYKITCIDANITDVYVGHTTNFVQRKHAHKASCVNEKSANYKCKLYETIRCNGGWSNWKMEIINFFNCTDHYEARKKEQEYFTLLNANLNSIEPLPKPKSQILKKDKIPIYCKSCNVYLQNTQLLEIHNNTKKHIKMCNINNDIKKIHSNIFYCKKCDYITCNKKDFNKHNNTKKHIINDTSIISIPKSQKNNYACICGKSYKDNSGLWRHKKTCVTIKSNNDDKDNIVNKINTHQSFDMNLLYELLKQNQELHKQIIEISLKNNSNN